MFIETELAGIDGIGTPAIVNTDWIRMCVPDKDGKTVATIDGKEVHLGISFERMKCKVIPYYLPVK